MNRPFGKRGRKAANHDTMGDFIEAEDRLADIDRKRTPLDESRFGSQDVIGRLVQIYHDTMYPK